MADSGAIKSVPWDTDLLTSLCLFPRTFLDLLPLMIDNYLETLEGVDVLPVCKHYLRIAMDPAATDEYIKLVLLFLLRFDPSTKELFAAYSSKYRLRWAIQYLYLLMDMLFSSCIEPCNAVIMVKTYLHNFDCAVLFRVNPAGLLAFHAYNCMILPVEALTSANPEAHVAHVDLSEQEVLSNASKPLCIPLLQTYSEKQKARFEAYLAEQGLGGSTIFYPDTPRPPVPPFPDFDYVQVYADPALVRKMPFATFKHCVLATLRDRNLAKGSVTQNERKEHTTRK
jgi:hypothetical protein